jgi:membrane protease YdiL (CAAX protease family)
MRYWREFKKSKTGYGILATLLIVGVFLMATLLMVPAMVVGQLYKVNDDLMESILMIAYPLSLIATVWLVSWIMTKKGVGGSKNAKDFKDSKVGVRDILGLKKPNNKVLWMLPAVIGGYLVLLIISSMILYMLSPDLAGQAQDVGELVARLGGIKLVATIIGVAILTPIAEELFFRGFSLWLYNKKLNLIWSIALTSILFGVAHAQVNVGIDTLLLGIGLSLLRWQTESIYPSIFVHMLKNSLAVMFLILS